MSDLKSCSSINIPLTTFNEILNNSLMPWLPDNSDSLKYHELSKRLRKQMKQDYATWFRSLMNIFNEMAIPVNKNLAEEWLMFSDINSSQQFPAGLKHMNSYFESNPKIAFYTSLIQNVTYSLWTSIERNMQGRQSETFRRYFIIKILRKIEGMISQSQSQSNPIYDNPDISIIFRLRLALIAFYLEIQNNYASDIDHSDLNFCHEYLLQMLEIPLETGQSTKEISDQIKQEYFGLLQKSAMVKMDVQEMATFTVENFKPKYPETAVEYKDLIAIAYETKNDFVNLKDEIYSLLKDRKENKQPEQDRWIGTAEVCKILKRNKSTVKSYRDKGILPYTQHKSGGKIDYKMKDVLGLKK